MEKGMKVLLFGGAGYIGSHVALTFRDRGHQIGIFDDLSTGLRENIPADCTFYQGDINDPAAVSQALSEGWDGIVHLAAFKAAGESMLEPEKYARNNIGGSLNLITEAVAKGAAGFLLSSSAAVYGEPEYLPVDEDHPTVPSNYYGFTKLEIERNLAWFETLRGLPYASLRYFNAAGYDPDGRITGLERNPANLIPIVMETALGRREELLIFGDDYPTPDGTGIRDYIHVTDLAEAHVSALEYVVSEGRSLTVNLGSEQGLSVQEILDTARRVTGRKIPARVTDRRAGDPARLVASARRAAKTLDWRTRHSSAEEILSTSWQAYRHG